jgi:uncharacterized delta-60 repeat protein
MRVSRFTLDGDLDNSFGSGGSVRFPFDDSPFTGIGQTTNGRIAVGGYHPGFGSLVVVFSPAGAVDTDFGDQGFSYFDMGVGPQLVQFVARADGRMYLAGFAYKEFNDRFNARVVAIAPNGDLDLTVGHSGWLQLPIPWQSDGPPALAGLAFDETNDMLHLVGSTQVDMHGPFPGAVLVPIGIPDPLTWPNPAHDSAFVSNSLSITSGGRDRAIADMYVRASGKLAVLLDRFNDEGHSTFSVEKRRRNGRLDTTFGTNGTYVFPSPRGLDRAGAIGDQNGSILVAGSTLGAASAALRLTRITPDGELDTTFGMGGHVSFTHTIRPQRIEPVDIEIDGSGRIVVLWKGWSESRAFAFVSRFSGRGDLDSIFSESVILRINNCATPTALEPHGMGYVFAVTETCTGIHPRIVRLTATGRIDNRFNQDGFRSAFGNPDRKMRIHALTTVGGTSTRAGRLAVVVSAGRTDTRLAVLTPMGSLVPSFGKQGSRPIDPAGRRFHLEEAARRRIIVTISGADLTRTTYLPTGRRDTTVPIATGRAAPSGLDEIIAIRAGRPGSPVYFAEFTWIGRSILRLPQAVACQPSPRC